MAYSIRSERLAAAAIAGWMVLVAAPPAHAQIAPTEQSTPRERAAEMTHRAGTLYKAGRFDEALAAYLRAYDEFPMPELLFNMGQCHKNLGNDERAIFFFSNFLRDQPQAANRAVVEELIDEARERLRAAEARQVGSTMVVTSTAVPPEPVDHSRPLYARWWVWAAVGAVVAGSATAYFLVGRDDSDPTGSLGSVDWR